MLRDYQNLSEIKFEFTEAEKAKMDKLYFKKAQMLYLEGSTPLGAYFIKKGRIKISKSGSKGKTAITRIVLQNEVVNYTDLFSQTNYTTSATAMEDSEVLFIPRLMFWDFIREKTELCDQVLQKLALDKKIMESRIIDFTYKPVKGRLADTLLALNQLFNGDGHQHILSMSRADLASYTGTSRETVNRFISEFRDDKLIETHNNLEITVLDKEGLMKISQTYNE